MNCPNCNTPNSPYNVRCRSCDSMMPWDYWRKQRTFTADTAPDLPCLDGMARDGWEFTNMEEFSVRPMEGDAGVWLVERPGKPAFSVSRDDVREGSGRCNRHHGILGKMISEKIEIEASRLERRASWDRWECDRKREIEESHSLTPAPVPPPKTSWFRRFLRALCGR
jgi:hypothetical protein